MNCTYYFFWRNLITGETKITAEDLPTYEIGSFIGGESLCVDTAEEWKNEMEVV